MPAAGRGNGCGVGGGRDERTAAVTGQRRFVRINDWPRRPRAERVRQWPALAALVERAAELDAVEGLVLLGSFARGEPDELSDIDVLVVAAPGEFESVWAARHRVAEDPLVTWESPPAPGTELGGFKVADTGSRQG